MNIHDVSTSNSSYLDYYYMGSEDCPGDCLRKPQKFAQTVYIVWEQQGRELTVHMTMDEYAILCMHARRHISMPVYTHLAKSTDTPTIQGAMVQ